MTIRTKQLLNQRKRLSRRKIAREKPTLVFNSLTLANSALIFSMGATTTLRVPVIDNTPVLNVGGNNNVALNIVAIYDETLISQFSAQLQEAGSFLELVDQNKNKLSITTISCESKNVDTSNSKYYSYSHSTTLRARSFVDRSSPFDVAIVAYVTRTRGSGKGTVLCGTPILQQVIVGNTLQPAANLIDMRPQNYDKYLEFDIINQVGNNTEAYFSDQFCSHDPENFLKFIFFWDKIQFLKENSSFGNILNNTSLPAAREKMIADSLITDLRIVRTRIKHNFDGFSSFDKNQVPAVIVSSSESESDGFLNAETINPHNKKVTAKISSLSNVENTGEYMTFLVNDYIPQTIRLGLYQYSVRIRVQDGMLKFLLDSSDLLRYVNKQLESYANIFTPGPSEAKEAASANLQAMLDVLFSLSKFSESSMQAVRAEFSLLLDSFEGVTQAMSFNDNLRVKINDALGTRGIANTSAKGRTISKNTSKLYFLEDKQTFPEVVNLSDFNNVKYEYMGLTDVLGTGAAAFLIDDVEDRFFTEFKKVINYDGRREEINFADLNTQLYGDNLQTNKNAKLKDNLFSLQPTYYAYLSPAVVDPRSAKPMNIEARWSPSDYNKPTKTRQEDIDVSYAFQHKGITIESAATRVPPKAADAQKASSIFGAANKINSENVSAKNKSTKEATNKSFKHSITKSSGILNGVNKFYNNIDLTKQNFDLNNSSNLLKSAQDLSSPQQSVEMVEEMPNQIRALFGSRSDAVVNKWALTENDFFSNPATINMIKENYSNLIKIEVLTDFGEDVEGEKIAKLPIFKKLELSDIEGLTAGNVLFCRTYRVDQKSLGIGMKSVDDTSEDIYYNKYFIITQADFN